MEALSTRELIAAGFQELDRAAGFLKDPQLADVDLRALLLTLRVAPDPDQALLLLIRLLERAEGVAELLVPDAAGRMPRAVPMLRLLGASPALGEFLVRRPEHADLLAVDGAAMPHTVPAAAMRAELLAAVRADGASPGGAAAAPEARLAEDFTVREATAALRVAYRRQLTALALRDLCAEDPLEHQPLVSRQLADLAGAALDAALAVSRAELVARHGAEVRDVELAVIGMGKCGARELNYVSDVDVIHVHRAPEHLEASRAGTLAAGLASGIARVVDGSAPEPGLWEVDANLRPEGKDGPLSRSLESHLEYYRRWAHGWEFQALLKARPVAGSADLGEAYIAAIWPQVWSSSQQEGFVENVQRMRRRVFATIPDADVARELKLGRGGLRDIEFTVQLLQLVHGRVDESLHVRDTLTAIRALGDGEYMAVRDQDAMSRCYRWLRLLEHRIQMTSLRRTHLMPVREEELRALAHAIQPPSTDRRHKPEGLQRRWRDVVREVTSFHETIFYRPLLSTTAVLSDEEVRLSSEAAQARLAALGYSDTPGAMRHIEALTSGVTRRATLQRRILPMMLGWFAEGVDPDAGLIAFRRLSESLGSSPWYLTMLRDSSVAAERLCDVLSSSRFISDQLEHSPESTRWLGDDDALRPLSYQALWTEVQNQLARHEGDAMTAVRLTRLVRQREVLRIAIADAAGRLDIQEIGRALSDVDRACTLGALRVAEQDVFAAEEPQVELLVVAMGRQGGREITYGSDMDALFVHRALPGADSTAADAQAQRLASRMSALLTGSVKPPVRGEHPLQIDADLRPEGRKGTLSRSLESFREYYRRWMDVWERQALLRARPLAGSDGLAAEFIRLVDEVRFGAPPTDGQIREIRRIKARVESERLPRGADPSRHVKLGRGALSDVEWLVQLTQLQHGHDHATLRGQSTLPMLEAMVAAELITAEDAAVLAEAWTLCTRVRAGIKVWTGRSGDVLPSGRRDLEAVARWCGFEAGEAAAFEEHYLRTTRRCRQVYERLFYTEA
ncbi:bifunctional [glutamine synthetase] adenylyltransferase/[glutamine synthetase]-adenylyl-L-tyrosine phosphorylase [Nesterenkonia halophila]